MKSRSSNTEVFLGNGALKTCSKFKGEHLWRSNISIKLRDNFIEITLWHGCSPVNMLHIFRTPFPKNTSIELLLNESSRYKRNFSLSAFSLSISGQYFRSSRTEVSCKKDVLRNFAKFTGKHLCQGLFFNKVAGFSFLYSLKTSIF